MNSHDLIALIDQLRAFPTETEWLEFKRNYADAQEIGQYLSALANEACLCNQPRGYLIFGIDDTTHDVVDSRFDPYKAKAKGNQDHSVTIRLVGSAPASLAGRMTSCGGKE